MRKFFTTGTILAVLATLLIFLSLGVAAAPVADLTSLNVNIGGSNLIDFRTTIPTYTVNINSTDILTVTANAGSGEEVSLDFVGESSGWQSGSASLIIASGRIYSGQDRNIMVSVREIASTTTKNYTITVHAQFDTAELISNPAVTVGGASVNVEGNPIPGYAGQVNVNSVGSIVFTVPNSSISNKGSLKSITPSSFNLDTIGATQDVVIIILSESGTEMVPYKYRVTRTANVSNNANLSGLTITPNTGNAGIWSTSFCSTTLSYTYTLPTGSAATSVTITPTVAEDEATVTVNDTSVTSGSGGTITLSSLSITTIKVVVTAPDGITKNTYTINVYRIILSSNNDLSALTIRAGSSSGALQTLYPGFNSGRTEYDVFVPYSISTVYISTIRYDNTSSVSINGDTGTARSISISTGNNTINVQVTAANGNVKTYTVQVRRATSSANNESNLSDLVLRSGSSGSNTVNLDPSFESGITSYTAYMADGITFCRFVPTISDSDARAIVAGYVTTSGSVSNSVSLAQGKNIITVRVIAADCTTATDYNITIIRERSKFFVPIGTPDQEAIPIYTAEDLDNARNKLDGSYVLMNDIDLAEWGEWEPIGDASNWYNKDNYYYNSFKGTFDGQGHVIRNLTISGYTDSTYSGLFGFSEGASIKNLGLEDINVDITSSAANMRLYVGGISGLSSEAIINNCYTTGIISTVYAFPADHNNDGHDGFYDIISVGGICGLSNITEIYNCYNQANISSSSSFTKNPPGFRVSTYSYVGGICGSGRGSDGIIISSCSNTGNISVISDYEARAGGIIGDINRAAAITSSYNAGNISAFCPNSGARAGGIYGCGFAYYSKSIIIKNCYNAGSISAKAPNFSAYAGGIGADTIASMSDDPRDYGYAEITSCFVLSGEIIAEADIDYPRESNLVSFDWGGNVHKINNLALTGIQGNAIDDATRRISQSEAKEQATYEELGWDFGGIWQMVEGYKYPQLYGLPLDEPEHISADSTLASLTISAGTLYPAFNPYFTNYTATVVNSVSSISVNATANNSKATVLGAGIKSLDVGFNTIILTVTAEDGTTTRTYTIDVNRAIDSAGSVSSSGGATSYTLTFDSNGGSMITSQKVGAGSKITKPANPTKDGFKFIGWFSDAALTKEYDFNATVSSSLTLYAKWEEIAEVKMETWQNPFTDVNSGNWFYENVKYVVTKGLFNGTGPTTFAPQSTMTRAMLFTVLARLAGVNTEGGATWYSLALDWAVKEGLTDGSNPQNPVTREQIVTILWRYADKPAGEGNLKVFPDAASASEWAVGAFEWAIGTGIINGSGGNLLPKGMATRAEVAAILHRFAELPK